MENLKINGDIFRAFIPKNFIVKCQDGKIRYAKYADSRGFYINEKVGIDFYYSKNFAVLHLIAPEDISKIDGFEETKTLDSIGLYKKAFKKEIIKAGKLWKKYKN